MAVRVISQDLKTGAIAFIAGLICFAPAPAQAQEPGVHIDPGGPAGREYAIPAVTALDDTGAKPPRGGSGATGSTPAAGADNRLFGVGVGEPGATAPRKSSRHGSRGGASRPPAAARPAQHADTASAPSWREVTAGNASTPWIVPSVALAVLAAAGLLAVALRRRGPSAAL
jgi:hypothetical protein